MDDDMFPFGAIPGQNSMVESVSDYYRRRADRERQCADDAVDHDLRRIHLDRAASMQRLADQSQTKS